MKNIVIVSGMADKKTIGNLRDLNFPMVEVGANPNTYEQVSSHPDMNFMIVDENIYACTYFYDNYGPIMKAYGYSLFDIGKLSSSYPENILCNFCVLDDYIIGRIDKLSTKISETLSRTYTLVDVRQGYAKCSCVVVDGKSIITSDKGIYKVLVDIDVDVLLVEEDDIVLKGFDNGFIGGATGSCEAYVFFNGDISQHRDYQAIRDFVESRNKKIKMIHGKKLEDVGTIFFAKDLRKG